MAKLPPSTGFCMSSNLSCCGISSSSFSTDRASVDRNWLRHLCDSEILHCFLKLSYFYFS